MAQIDADIVLVLGTIHQRTALNGQLSPVIGNPWVGFHQPWFYVEMQTHHIPLLPFAVDDDVAVFGDGCRVMGIGG